MIVITSLEELEQINKSAVTIGKFDGLHKGHKALIEKTVDYAKKNNMKSVVFTFSNHPANFFESEKVRKIITNKYKINNMKEFGVDIVINLETGAVIYMGTILTISISLDLAVSIGTGAYCLCL